MNIAHSDVAGGSCIYMCDVSYVWHDILMNVMTQFVRRKLPQQKRGGSGCVVCVLILGFVSVFRKDSLGSVSGICVCVPHSRFCVCVAQSQQNSLLISHCNTLQHTATLCNILPHTATHYKVWVYN